MIDAAVAALPRPGLLLIRAALSQQSSKQCTDVKAQEVVSDVQAGTWSQLASGPSKRLHQSLKPPGGAVEPLARIDYFDFDDLAFAAAYGINGMHADRAIIDKPRHH